MKSFQERIASLRPEQREVVLALEQAARAAPRSDVGHPLDFSVRQAMLKCRFAGIQDEEILNAAIEHGKNGGAK